MSILKAIRTQLLTESAITDLVSSRIYTQWRVSDAMPAITITRVYEDHLHDLQGSAGFATARLQIDCWGKSYETLDTLGEAVRSVLQGFSGTVDGVLIWSVTLQNRADFYDSPQDGTNKPIRRVMLEFSVSYAESIPTS